MGPNLRTPDPDRKHLSPKNVVLFDLTAPLKEISDALLRVEELPDMATRNIAAAAIERLVDRALMLRARTLGRPFRPSIITGASMSVERMERLQQQAEERREAKEERRRKNREEWAALNRTTGHASKWWTPSN